MPPDHVTPETPSERRIPFVDLRAQYESLRPEIDDALRAVLESGQFVLGRPVADFERSFASYLGVRECVCVNSGTAALHLGLVALGLGAGDEVIVPANTFFAAAEAVIWAGGRVVVADVSEDDATIDPGAIEAAVTPRTRGVVPVDLYGQPARYDEILSIAARHGLFVLEDACQAHGAALGARKAGAFGAAGAFSFYPGKNLGAYGEGGALVTNDPGIAERVRALRDHGQVRKYDHALVGHNFRLEALQGAVLGVKLSRLDAWNAQRRRVAGWYREGLAGLPVRMLAERQGVLHAQHLCVVRVASRDAFRRALAEEGIETLIHYPIPLHLQTALRPLGYGAGAFPIAERLCGEIVSLPIYPEMSRELVGAVCAAAERACRRPGPSGGDGR